MLSNVSGVQSTLERPRDINLVFDAGAVCTRAVTKIFKFFVEQQGAVVAVDARG